MNQDDLIRRHLKSGLSITPMDALNLYGCFRLAAVIFRLRKEFAIKKVMENPAGGRGNAYARYSRGKR